MSKWATTNPEFCNCTMSKHPGVLVAILHLFILSLERLLWNRKNHLETITSAQTKLTTDGCGNLLTCSPLTPDAYSREASTVVQTFRDTGIGLQENPFTL